MNRNYILSNKENEPHIPKSPIKLKINYQARQPFYDRSKSPLKEESLNCRTIQKINKQHKTPPLSNKNTDYNRIYLEESSVQPVSKMISDNGSMFNNLKSTPEPSMIKPISLEIKKLEEKKKSQQKFPYHQSDNDPSQNDLSYSKSRHRQNSKHLEFFAKVGNLQKMSNQISSLLSYVYENKTASKEQKKNEDNSSYKPRFGQVSQNPKSYQRRLTGLQKPKQAQPLVSNFEVQEKQNKQRDNSVKRQRRNLSKYQYSTFDQQSKSPYKLLDENRERDKSTQKRSLNYVRRDVSPKHQQTESNFDEQIGILKTVKSQNFVDSDPLISSESVQKLSKITTSNNPDLEFYYDSLKKRDAEIQNFKKKFLGDDAEKLNKYNQNEQIFSEKYKAPFKRRNQPRNQVRNENSSLTNIQPNSQKDMLITKEQIQIYKDLNKMSHHNHQERPSANRLEKIAQRRTNLEKTIRQEEFNYTKSSTAKRSGMQKTQSLNYTLQDSFSGTSRQLTKLDQRKQIQRNVDTKITFSIDQKIQKIKNQLKDCHKQKSYLRQKYSSILSKETANFEQKNKHQYTVHEKPLNQHQSNEIHEKADNQRMFESQNNKRFQSPCLLIQTSQNYQNELRQKIYSEERQSKSIQQNQLFEIKKSQIYEVRGQNQCEMTQNNQNFLKKQIEYQSEQNLKQTFTSKQILSNSVNEQQRYESFGAQISRHFQKKRPITPKKQFSIQLHKVQITKPETTKIGTLLAEKIQIDLKLRNQRQKFMKSTNPNKWSDLKSYLENRYQISKSLKELEQLITISPEQHNPFSPTSVSSTKSNSNKFSKSHFETSEQIPLLCSLLAESLQFFKSRLVGKFSSKQLEKERFSFKELDLNSKGYLSLEDLICFVNLHSGKFYRNRDIIFFVKLLINHKRSTSSNDINSSECYSSAKGVNEYRLDYEFLWNILAAKE